ncbi:MAG TPA: hypothetical protein VMS17_01030 [Gemmataceae bacterium]|nr:hypothetical protein [Gemmataceae bacterium]
MFRAAFLVTAGAAIAAGLAVYADPPGNPGDDPPMLKKKGAPDVDDGALKPPADDKDKDKKPEAPKPDAPKPDGGDKGKPQIDPDEVLKDVSKSMHSAEEHLAKKEVGDPTRQAQEDALKGLDSLIDLAQNPPDDQGDKGDKDNKDNKDNKQAKQGADSQQGASAPKSGSMNRQGQRRQGSRKSQGGGKAGSGKQGSGQQQPGTQGGPSGLPGLGASTAGLIGSSLGQGPLLAASGAAAGTSDQSQDQAGGSGKGNNPADGNVDNKNGKPDAGADDPITKLATERWGELTPTLREEMKKYADLDDMKSMPEYQRRVDEFRKAAAAAQSQRKGN